MSEEEIFLSYWSARRRIRASVSSHLAHIETEISSPEQEDNALSENLSVHQLLSMSTDGHENYNDNGHEPISDIENSESEEHVGLAVDNDQTDIEQYFHQQNVLIDSDSCDSDSADECNIESLPGNLKMWAVKYQISNISLTELLAILKPICPSLPQRPTNAPQDSHQI